MSSPAAINPTMTAREWGLLILLATLWGSSFFYNGVAVQALPPLTIVFFRVSLAALVLWTVCRIRRVPIPRHRQAWLDFLFMGVINNIIPFSLIAWSQSHISSGTTAILNATTPFFGVLLAHIMTSDEKITVARLSGVVLGFAGVAVLIGLGALNQLGVNVLAQSAVLGAAILYALSGIFARRFSARGVSPLASTTGMVTCSSLLLLPVMMLIDQPWTLALPDLGVVGSVFALAVLSTATAYLLFFRIIATAGATNTMQVTLLVPVVAILLGILFLDETLHPRHMAGMGLIALGLLVVDGRLFRKLAKWIKNRR